MTHPDPSGAAPAERINQIFTAVNRSDWDTVLSYWTDDGVLDMSPAGLGEFRDHDSIRAFWGEFAKTFENSERAPAEIDDLGNGVTLVVVAAEATAPGTSLPVISRSAYLYEWADNDLVERLTVYLDLDEARTVAERLASSK